MTLAPPPAGPLRVAVVDDEPAARAGMRALLGADPELEFVGEAADGHAAVALIVRQRPDVVLLDVQMPGGGGFDVLRALGDDVCPDVIFVTAHQVHAPAAFDVRALDYVLKPFTDARLAESIARAKARRYERRLQRVGVQTLEALSLAMERADRRDYLRAITAKSARRVVVIPAHEVTWIEGASYYARVHAGTKSHLIRETLSDLDARLDPGDFLRVHRSAIVNLRRVKEVGTPADGDPYALMDSGERVPISRGRLAALIGRLG